MVHEMYSLVCENKFQVISVMHSLTNVETYLQMGWGFSAQFLGIIIFNIDSYYRDTTCSKCITK